MMSLIRVLALVVALMAVVPAAVDARQPPAAQDEFVPIDQLPPEEQVPAAPMVVAAYGFVWAAFLVYVLSIVRRMNKVESDLALLEREHRP
jgi:CcmD family protein